MSKQPKPAIDRRYKTAAEKAAAAERRRIYQRDWHRRKRAIERTAAYHDRTGEGE